jgi:ribonuclease-3 family protein
VAEYHASTGFEALLGSLYLTEQHERLYEIAEAAFKIISQAMMQEIQEKKD